MDNRYSSSSSSSSLSSNASMQKEFLTPRSGKRKKPSSNPQEFNSLQLYAAPATSLDPAAIKLEKEQIEFFQALATLQIDMQKFLAENSEQMISILNKQYRRLNLKYHPDKNPDKENQKKVQKYAKMQDKIKTAHEIGLAYIKKTFLQEAAITDLINTLEEKPNIPIPATEEEAEEQQLIIKRDNLILQAIKADDVLALKQLLKTYKIYQQNWGESEAEESSEEKYPFNYNYILKSADTRSVVEIMQGKTEENNIYEASILYLAARFDKKNITQFLLSHGAEVDNSGGNRLGETPLHVAAQKGNIEIVKLLIKYKADVNARANHANGGYTPLCLAMGARHHQVVMTLIANGATSEAIGWEYKLDDMIESQQKRGMLTGALGQSMKNLVYEQQRLKYTGSSAASTKQVLNSLAKNPALLPQKPMLTPPATVTVTEPLLSAQYGAGVTITASSENAFLAQLKQKTAAILNAKTVENRDNALELVLIASTTTLPEYKATLTDMLENFESDQTASPYKEKLKMLLNNCNAYRPPTTFLAAVASSAVGTSSNSFSSSAASLLGEMTMSPRV
jgi:hypothetical protein